MAAQAVPSHNELQIKSVTPFVTVSGTRFLDPSETPIVFHGINICNKSREQNYTGDISTRVFEQIRSWGMNSVRLCIFWDGLEPRPGYFDTAYLDRIALLVEEAKRQGLYVLLDMHQDLYSVKFGDGAPLWATFDDGKPHSQVNDWNDAYYVSEDVQTALDHFWANSPAPDGQGLQDHYAQAWKFVASRFQDEPNILGYDLMNEPFPGAAAAHLEAVMLTCLSKSLAGRPGQPHPSLEQLVGMEGTPEGRRQIVKWMQSMRVYKTMLQAGAPGMQDFDRSRLMPMYSRVREAIRQVDRRHILFLEPDMSTNLGIRTGITPLVDDQNKHDPEQAYSPHVYDIVVDTALLDLMSMDRIKLTVDRDRLFSRRVHMPILVGEWGAFYLDPSAAKPTRDIEHIFDDLGCSEMFWAFREAIAQWPGLDALRRPAVRH
jgi:endoglycosylceramidase